MHQEVGSKFEEFLHCSTLHKVVTVICVEPLTERHFDDVTISAREQPEGSPEGKVRGKVMGSCFGIISGNYLYLYLQENVM